MGLGGSTWGRERTQKPLKRDYANTMDVRIDCRMFELFSSRVLCLFALTLVA